jgi:prepilin-type N-terminal cleavage/methylation domain-containing protein
MRFSQEIERGRADCERGFTLAEVIVAIALTALVLGSLINGYIITARRAEWTAMSEAAQQLVIQRMEQARAARWDLTASVPIDQLVATNFPTVTLPLYTPMGGTSFTTCTNVTTINQVSATPPVKMIRTDCCWSFVNGRLYTNSLMLYRSPDP